MKLKHSLLSGNYCNTPTVFADNGTKLLCAYSSEVKAISLPSGELLNTFAQHATDVTCMRLVNEAAVERDTATLVVSASKDGKIFVWRWTDFQVVRELSVGLGVNGLLLPSVSSLAFGGGSNVGGSTSTTGANSGGVADELYLLINRTKKDIVSHDHNNDHENISSSAEKSQLKLVVYDIAAKKVRKKVTSVTSKQCVGSISLKGVDYLVAASKRKVFFVSTKTREGPKFVSDVGTISCLSVHQERGLVLTGHEHGEICIWHDIPKWVESTSKRRGSSGKKKSKKDKDHKNGDDDESDDQFKAPVMTLMHWHSHCLRSLSFSNDGSYAYSGGEEGVLVMWQLATGIKSFVPRMGGTIGQVSADLYGASMKVAVTTLDNTVHIVDVSKMREEWAVQSLLLSSSTSSSSKQQEVQQQKKKESPYSSTSEAISWSVPHYKCFLRQDPVNGYLVGNGAPGKLQAFDPWSRSIRWVHDVVQYTRISRTEKHLKIFAPAVLDFVHHTSQRGVVYMATLDARRGEDKAIVYSIKFWVWDQAKATYRMSAQVEDPHGNHSVTSIAFVPSGGDREVSSSNGEGEKCISYFASGADDGSVKIWKVVNTYDSNNSNNSQIAWTCAFSFRHKDSRVGSLTFSLDGSLLALAQGNVVSLWDPMSVAFKRSLTIPASSSSRDITFVQFVEPRFSVGSGRAYLIVGTSTSVSLFDLLTMTTKWEKTTASSGDAFTHFAVANNEKEAIWSNRDDDDNDDDDDDDDEDDMPADLGALGVIAVASTGGKVSLLSIASGAEALAEFDTAAGEEVLSLSFGTTVAGGNSNSKLVSGLFVTTAAGLAFLSAKKTAVSAAGANTVVGQTVAGVSHTVPAALPVEGHAIAIADAKYSHADELGVNEESTNPMSNAERRPAAGAGTGTGGVASGSLPPVSSLVSSFLGAHLRNYSLTAAAPSSHAHSLATVTAQDSHSIVVPGESASHGIAVRTNKKRLSTAGLSMDTDSSSGDDMDDHAGGKTDRGNNNEGKEGEEDDNEEQESRVNIKRRRSSSLDKYHGAAAATTGSILEGNSAFLGARMRGNMKLASVFGGGK